MLPFTLSLSKGRSWFDKLTTNGSIGLLGTPYTRTFARYTFVPPSCDE